MKWLIITATKWHFRRRWKETRTFKYNFTKLSHTKTYTEMYTREIPTKSRRKKCEKNNKHSSKNARARTTATNAISRTKSTEHSNARMHFIYQPTNREREGCTWTSGKHQPTPRILSYYYFIFRIWRWIFCVLLLLLFFTDFISFSLNLYVVVVLLLFLLTYSG